MSYRVLRISSLSSIPAGYNMSVTDVMPVTIGTTTTLSSVKMTVGEFAQWQASPYNMQNIWISAGNSTIYTRSGLSSWGWREKFGINSSAPTVTLEVSGNDAMLIPIGTTAERPGSPANGHIRYNTTTHKYEGYCTSSWGPLGGISDQDDDTYISMESFSGNDDDGMTFFTAGTRTMTLCSNGNLGIGTTTPSLKLDIYTSGSNEQSINLNRASTTAEASIRFQTAGSNEWIMGLNNDTSGDFYIYDYASASQVFTIQDTTGKVGIGTDDPAELLHVYGPAPGIRVENSQVGGCGLNIKNTAREWEVGSDNAPDVFYIRDVSNSDAMRLTIDNTGNVGIGTTSPDNELHVDFGNSGYLKLEYNAAGWSGLEFDEAGSTRAIFNWDDLNNRFDFYAGGATSTDIAMSILEGGNVGIGTDDPSGKLSVYEKTADEECKVVVRTLANQGGDPYIKFDSGGTNFVVGEKWIGTTNNYLVLGPGENPDTTSGIFVKGNGNVGIGTTGPSYKLSVLGTTNLEGAVRTTGQITSTITTGTAPFVVASNTKVANLNADMVDGYSQAQIAGSLVANGDYARLKALDGTVLTDFSIPYAVDASNLRVAGAVDQAGTAFGVGLEVGTGEYSTSIELNNAAGTTVSRIIAPYANDSGTVNGKSVNQHLQTSNKVQFKAIGINTGADVTAGQLWATSDIIAYYSSDVRLKENIVSISDSLDKVSRINGVSFDWTDEHIEKNGGLQDYFVRKHDVGVIAQEIEEVLPEAVCTRDDGTMAVRYEKIVPLLIEAIKDLSEKVKRLEEDR